jgi:hypothetical protein
MSSVSDYFLSPAATADDWQFLASARTGVTVTPLIDGVDTFKALEQAVAAALKTVNLAAWIFNAWQPLQAKSAVNRKLAARGVSRTVTNWGELFVAVAGLGVEVRILLADFDAVLQDKLHEFAWQNYQKLRADAAKLAGGHLQAMVSMHDARAGAIATLLASTNINNRLTKVLARINAGGFAAAQIHLDNMPRLWPLVVVNKSTSKIEKVSSPSFDICPAAHHQKICIIDSAIAFCGGLDPQIGRIDTPQHRRGWHDTHVRADVPLAGDLDRNFAGRWNHEMGAFNTFIGSAALGAKKLPAIAVTAMTVPSGGPTSGSGPGTGQLIRTLSKNGLGTVPTNVRKDIELAYQQVIGLAQQFVYIEDQYVRSDDLANWLIAQATAKPGLQVIIVLPVAPEEVSSGSDPVTDLGLSLEHDALIKLKAALKANFGMYSMVMPLRSSHAHATDSQGSPQIYVHSKTMIVDDVWATIGSANTNPRSFEVDTEANIHWYDPVGVKALRLALWNEMLGSPAGMASWMPSSFVSNWESIASANKTRAAVQRQGFIVPHDPSRFPGKGNSQIPDAFAELGDVPSENDELADDALA